MNEKLRKVTVERGATYESDAGVTGFTFKMDRFIDGFDLMELVPFLKMKFIDDESDKFLLTKAVDGDDENKIVLTYDLTARGTRCAGTAKCQISFENESMSEVVNSEIFTVLIRQSVRVDGMYEDEIPSAVMELQRELMQSQARIEDVIGNYADDVASATLDDTNTTEVFKTWYAKVKDSGPSKYELLSRFFGLLAKNNDHTHTVRFFRSAVSGATTGEPFDDLYDKDPASLYSGSSYISGSTWANEDRLTWYIRANAESNADGTMDILYIESETGFDKTGEVAPVYTFQLAPYFRKWTEGDYEFYSWRALPKENYSAYPWDVPTNGVKRNMTWHATFEGAKDSDGKLTSGTDKTTERNRTLAEFLELARARTGYDGLYSDCDATWLLYEWMHRHFDKGNSGILDGCINFDHIAKVAVAESHIKRILLPLSEQSNFCAGCSIILCTSTSGVPTRDWAMEHATTAEPIKVVSVGKVTKSGTQYASLGFEDYQTTTLNTYVVTMPWQTGATETIEGHNDGGITTLTAGVAPIRIAGIEVFLGNYETGADPLYNVTASGSKFNYRSYTCKDSEYLSDEIAFGYDAGDGRANSVVSGVNYVSNHYESTDGTLTPSEFNGTSSSYYKSAFVGVNYTGVCAPLRFGSFFDNFQAGLSYLSPTDDIMSAGDSFIATRLAGAGKKRL